MEKTTQEILHGNITKTSFKLAAPVIVGHLLMMFYNFADTIFISRIDPSSTALMSGVGLVFPVFFLYIAIGVGIFAGVSSLVARSIGSKDEETLDRVADSGLFFAITISLISVVVLYPLSNTIVDVLAGSKISNEAVTYAKEYLKFIIPGFGIIVINDSLLGILQGEGKPHYFGMIMILSTILNIILDPIFIFVIGMGVPGAALASTIAISIACLTTIAVFITERSALTIHWNILKARFSIIIEILRIGIPQIMMMGILTISFIFLNKLVSSLSEAIMNSWVIAGRMNEFILLVGYGMGGASLTMAGQNFGAKNFSRIKDILNTITRNSIFVGIFFAIILNIVAPFIFPLFTDVDEVIQYSILQVRIHSIAGIGVIVDIVCNNTFQGVGKATPGLLMTFVRMAVVTVPVSYVFIYFFNGGFISMLFTMLTANAFSAIVIYLWARKHIGNLQPVPVST